MKESAFRSKVREAVLRIDPLAVVRVNEARFAAGFPDLTIVSQGRAFFLELKVWDGAPNSASIPQRFTALQVRALRDLERAGATARGIVYQSRGGLRPYLVFTPSGQVLVLNQFWQYLENGLRFLLR